MENMAAYLKAPNFIELDKAPAPEAGDGEVVVKIGYVGICGSDVHFYQHGRIGPYIVEYPYILGHECAGTVVSVGKGVTRLKAGDRVALEPGATCGVCEFCVTGRYNLCPDVKFLATPPYQGALVNYLAFPERLAFKLPDNVSSMEGALLEPLAVGLHAAKQGKVGMGDCVVILGAGCIGLVTLLACKTAGASNIIVSDVFDKRLAFAKSMGAHNIINVKETDLDGAVKDLTGGKGADVVIETAGACETVAQTAHIVKRGGRIVFVGLAPEDVIPFDFSILMSNEISVETVFRYRNLYPTAIGAVASGALNVKQIVTHTYAFADTDRAFREVIQNKTDVVKAIIEL